MRFEVAACTDKGISKSTNQDSLIIKCMSTNFGDMVFAVLCDGMGGLSKGELASATVVRAFDSWCNNRLPELCSTSEKELDTHNIENQWRELVTEQNNRIKEYGNQKGENLGTTVVALLLTQEKYYLLNVGDSRIYRLGTDIERLTTDQTFIQREISLGNMTPEQAMKDPRRNVLLQCVGASAQVDPEFGSGPIEKDTAYLLCSDGFRHEITEQEIYAQLCPKEAVGEQQMHDRIKKLIELDMQRQERDNITAALITAR